jgi:RHS repeat-associated protein
MVNKRKGYISDSVNNFALNSSMDFKEYTEGTTVEYTYNANGAMVKDMNKGISAIAYNSLNLPRMVDIKSKTAEGRNEYTYSASGVKLKAVQKWNPNYNSAPVIGSDVNVSSLTMSSTTDYVGNIIYENGNLKRILVDGGYYESGNYYFYINDHLGNNRIVANAAASVVQSTQYYPFGMPFADATGVGVQPYKYNNKELDGRNGLNWYDNGARPYNSPFPNTPTPDPHAENYYSLSPYSWVGNNPMKYIDPTGMDSINVNNSTTVNYIERNAESTVSTIATADAVNNGIGGGAEGAGNISGTFRLQGGANNSKLFSPKYYPSGFTGAGSTVTTYSFSKIAAVGKVTTVVSVAMSAYNVYEGVQLDGGTYGDNAQIATGKAVGGISGAWLGAKSGASIGASIGIWFDGVGVIPGTIIGGVVGGIIGGFTGDAIGGKVVEETKAMNK